MTRFMIRKLLCLLLAVMNGCISGVVRDRETGDGDPIKAVKHRLSEVRGLEFIAEVPFQFEEKESLIRRLEADFQADQNYKKPEDVSLAYAKLGLLPAGIDLVSSFLKFYSSQVQGFYNSTSKMVFLLKGAVPGISGSTLEEGIDTRALVHELTHALQDQHFSIFTKLQPSNNSDRILALRSVAEADAVVSEYAYRFGGLQDWLADYVRQAFDAETGGATSPDVPMLVADKLRFPYLGGLNFVSRVLDDQGWLPLNLIYQYPPLSTEQVLHPEIYFGTPDPPVDIRFGSLTALFPPEWIEIENDTLGELMVHCLFKQFLDPQDTAVVAEGWGGDRFVAFRNGDNVAFIWATVWDSATDAREFYDMYKKLLSMKYGAALTDSAAYVEKRDRSVIVVEGLQRDRVKRNIGAVWDAMVLERESFRAPPFSASLRRR